MLSCLTKELWCKIHHSDMSEGKMVAMGVVVMAPSLKVFRATNCTREPIFKLLWKSEKIFAYFPDYLHESAYIWPLRKGLIHVSCYILFHSVLFNSLHFVLDLITLLPESEVEIFICITGFLYLIFCIHISWSCCVYNCTVYLAERKGESDKRH